jgi:DNA repair protein RadD
LQQSKKKSRDTNDAHFQTGTPRSEICRLHSCGNVFQRNDTGASDQKIQHEIAQTKRRVWDILNAGPRHRFTCEGLLVSNCLILDFGNNIERHGPIDAIDYGKNRVKRGGETLGPDDEGKECPNCQLVVPTRKRKCDCGFEWMEPREPKHDNRPDTQNSILSEDKRYEVIEARAREHVKPDKPVSLRMDYRVAPHEDDELDLLISEWICLEHEGFARHKAEQWWARHSLEPVPSTASEAVDIFDRGGVAIPRSIVARKEGRFWRIVSSEVEEIPVMSQTPIEEEVPF